MSAADEAADVLQQRIESKTYLLTLIRTEPSETLVQALLDYCIDVEELCRSYMTVFRECLGLHSEQIAELRARLERREEVR